MEVRRMRWFALLLVASLATVVPACQASGTSSTSGASGASGASGTPSAPTPSPSVGPFRSSIARISEEQAGWMRGKSWHAGCPVPISALRVVSLDHFDFDGAVAQGKLVVNRKVAPEIVSVFEQLFDARFPIMHMDPTDLHPPGEIAVPVYDDTVGFNCRPIAGTNTWSQHAYGLAVDINPEQNPWVKGERVVPRAGKAYVDRSQMLQGMVHEDDAVVHAFAGIGWGWGGDWSSMKDYMHFSSTGG